MRLFLECQKINMMRLFLLVCLLGFNQLALAKEWAFDVYLDKSKIGSHTFTLDNNNQLISKAKFNVKVLFINAYNYLHTAKEQWQNDCIVSLDANTLENKISTQVSGSSIGEVFTVKNGVQSKALPQCVMTFAYWNPKILEQKKLLNPQNAEYLETRIENIGVESINVKGKSIEASHYLLKGDLNGVNKLNIELWYDKQNNWVALKSITPEGYTINYKLK